MTTEAKVLTAITGVTVLIITIGAFSFGGKTTADKPTTEVLATEDQKLLVKPDSNQIVSPKAKVTLVEFGDFQCPACGSVNPIVEQITEEYKGKITFVFRNFPLAAHKNAMIAAEAAEAAGAQGKYFQMHSMLYDKQADWSESDKPMEHFEKYAKELKLDINKFKSEIESNKYEKKIQQDITDGTALGVDATPTFYINGVKQVGGLPYDEFKAKIEEELSRTK